MTRKCDAQVWHPTNCGKKEQQGADIGETKSTGETEVVGKPTEDRQTRAMMDGGIDTQQLVGYDVARSRITRRCRHGLNYPCHLPVDLPCLQTSGLNLPG